MEHLSHNAIIIGSLFILFIGIFIGARIMRRFQKDGDDDCYDGQFQEDDFEELDYDDEDEKDSDENIISKRDDFLT